MAVHELSPIREYEEPDKSQLKSLSKKQWNAERQSGTKLRVKIINKAGVVVEPLQEGVKRYPSIVVRPEEIEADINRLTP